MQLQHTNDIEHVCDAPKECPCCGGRITRQDFDEERDTGCSAYVCFSCDTCDVHWIAPPKRKDEDNE